MGLGRLPEYGWRSGCVLLITSHKMIHISMRVMPDILLCQSFSGLDINLSTKEAHLFPRAFLWAR